MRAVKRSQKPVRRYRSLLFPAVSLLAVFSFYAAFVPSGDQALRRGEAMLFEHDGLRLEVTNVHESGQGSGGGMGEYPVYTVYPGAAASILEADTMEGAAWAFLLAPEDARLDIVDGMEPVEITEEVLGVIDTESGAYVLSFVLLDEGGAN